LRPALVRAALLLVAVRLSSVAGFLSLAGCCLSVVTGNGSESGTSGQSTGSGVGSIGGAGSTSAAGSSTGNGTTGATSGSSGSSTGTTSSTGGSPGTGATSGGSIPCGVPSGDPSTIVATLAGNGAAGFFDGSGGRDGTTQFYYPSGVAVDASGNVYVSDYRNNRIRKVAPDGSTTTLAGNGAAALADGSGGPKGMAEFDNPSALTLDGAGDILVVDAQDYSIRRVDQGGNVTTLPSTECDGTPFFDLFGIAVSHSGNILISDSYHNRICETDSVGRAAAIFAGGADPTFNLPLGLAVAPDGSVYVADNQSSVILRIDTAGNVTTFAGSGSPGYADGPGSSAEFNDPGAVAVDPQGNVIVGDSAGNRIRRIDPAGNVTTLAGNGQPGDMDGTGGANGTAEFNNPWGVAVDGACNVYVAGNSDERIRKITFGAPPP
jgi:sugar lactone lactonase YvrE